jgi:hypothetical protein
MPDFDAPPPSRRLTRPEYAGLTPEEIRQREVERIWGSQKRAAPPAEWQPAAPSPPEVLALLQLPHDGKTGMPLSPKPPRLPFAHAQATDAEVLQVSGRAHRIQAQYEADYDTFIKAYTFWATGLDSCQKSQLAAEVQFGGEDAPAWSVSSPQDPSQPPLVIKAPHAAEALARYKTLCGIRGFDQMDDYAEPLTATPYVSQESANGPPPPD